jgi:acetylornithine/succinyldiaminopimelate/putrescine aminotransferase
VTSKAKRAALEGVRRYLAPNRVDTFERLGVSLVIGRREGYRIWDIDGHELLDFHLNGGTFNLGHRNPELVATLVRGLEQYDIGNHHFPSVPRAELAADLVACSPGGHLDHVVFTPSGSEAIDVAIKSARRATGRRRIVAFDCAFHGRSGLSGAAGDPSTAAAFLADRPDEFATVPFGDLDAIAVALADGTVAAVLAEVIPATAGFPLPPDGYYPALRDLCDEHGTLLMADEVQTGLGRTGDVWAIDGFGAVPDVLVTGKGLSGGLYPIAATLLNARAGTWLHEDGWGYVSTFGGSELGCIVARSALARSIATETLANARTMGSYFRDRLDAMRERHPFLVEVRERGVVMGLRFAHRAGALSMVAALYAEGIWAMFSGFDPSVLQWKPGLLVDTAYADEALARFERALTSVEARQGRS